MAEYLSTDPNAGADSGTKYLSSDPNAGNTGAPNQAEQMSEGERRLTSVGRSFMKPVEAVQQGAAHLKDVLPAWMPIGALARALAGDTTAKEADLEAQRNAQAMQDVERASAKDAKTRGMVVNPIMPGSNIINAMGALSAGGVETLTDVATGAAGPGIAAAKTATLLPKIIAGAGTGAAYSMLNPVTTGKDFAEEKAKQGGIGAALGGGLNALLHGFGEIPGIYQKAKDLVTGKPPVASSGATGAGAEKVTDLAQSLRDRIEGKIAGKASREETAADAIIRQAKEQGSQKISGEESRAGERLRGTQTDIEERIAAAETEAARRIAEAEANRDRLLQSAEGKNQQRVQEAEKALEDARYAARELQTITPGEFGQTVRGVITKRKSDIDAQIDEATSAARNTAYSSPEKVDMQPVLDMIEKMKQRTTQKPVLGALAETEKAIKDAISKSGEKQVEALPGYVMQNGKFVKSTEAAAPSGASVELAHDVMKGMRYLFQTKDGDKFAQMELKAIQQAIESQAPQAFKDYMKIERAERSKLDPFSAQSGPGARTAGVIQKDQYGQDFMSNPESIGGKFFREGPQGAAAIREFKTATNNDPDAIAAMGKYVAWNLREMPPEKWGGFLRKNEPALKELGMYDSLKAYEQAAIRAESGVKGANTLSRRELSEAQAEGRKSLSAEKSAASDEIARAKAISSAQRSASDKTSAEAIAAAKAEANKGLTVAEIAAKERVESAKQTAKNVQGILNQNVLGKLTTDAIAYQRLTGQDAQIAIEKVFSGTRPERDLRQLVAITKNDPAAADGLRQSFKDWLIQRNPQGDIDTKALRTKWQDLRDPVGKSGLFDKQHIADIDKVMEELQKAEYSGGVKRSAGSIIGWIGGLLVGRPIAASYAGRNIANAATKNAAQKLDEMILQVAASPQGASILTQPPTPQNVQRFRDMIGIEFSPDTVRAMDAAIGRESGEQTPKRRKDPLALEYQP